MDNKKSFLDGKKLDAVKKKTTEIVSKYVSFVGTPKERKEAVDARLNYAAKGLGIGVLAYFFARAALPFNVYPFACVLICAASKYLPFIYIASLIGAISGVGDSLIMFLTYSAALMLRITVFYTAKHKKKIFSESVFLRMIICSVSMLFVGAYRIVSGGFLWFDIIGCVLGVLVAPMFVFLFCGVTVSGNKFTSYHDLGSCAVMSVVVYCLGSKTLFGFSLGCVVAFILTLYISKECGMLRGGIVGLICGLAFNTVYAPLFAIAGLVSGLFWKSGTLLSTLAAIICGVGYGVYANGFSALSELAPDLLCASLIFTPLSHYDLLPKIFAYSDVGAVSQTYNDNVALTKEQYIGSNEKLKSMGEALEEISRVFYTLSKSQSIPELSKVRERCESGFSKHCKGCVGYCVCWDKYYADTVEILNSLAIKMRKGSVAKPEDLEAVPYKKCAKKEEILKEINNNYAEVLKSAIESNKAEIFAVDYQAMAKMLEQAIASNAKEYELDAELTKKVKACARYLNLACSSLSVYGGRRKTITAGGIDLARVKLGSREIKRSFERVCRASLSEPSFSIDGDYITMQLRSRRKFKATYTALAKKKEDEEINGDCVCGFESREDYYYTLLSDGMGSGKEAALSSGISRLYLEKMLKCGNSKVQSVQMLNMFLKSKTSECFATLDLLEVDLLNGEASFVKSGAAPSYILRGTSVFKIASNTMPIGIADEINTEEVSFSLQAGDKIVMTSDGICSSYEDSLWLADMLTNEWQKGANEEEMCAQIIDEATEHNDKCDDMSVAIIKIDKATE